MMINTLRQIAILDASTGISTKSENRCAGKHDEYQPLHVQSPCRGRDHAHERSCDKTSSMWHAVVDRHVKMELNQVFGMAWTHEKKSTLL